MAPAPADYFRIEAREIVEGLGRGILALEKSARPEVIAELFRLAHTLKGAARVVKQTALAQSAHALEDRLAALRDGAAGAQPLPREEIDDLLRRADEIAGQVRALDAPAGATPGARGGVTPAAVVEAAPVLRPDAPALEELSRAIDLVAEQIRALNPDAEGVDRAERALREVRAAADALRLVPVASLFAPLERITRDLARTLGKEAQMESRGGDLRLDPQLLTVVHGALVQLLRNALAHGIEPAAERARAGKPPAGRILLEAVRRGGRVSFACRDDGRGVDVEAVRRAAASRGLLAEGAPLKPAELLGLLLSSGVTTSGAVTEIAGRGVGLDVVRVAAEQLGGELTMTTTPGAGTTFELTVPVSASSVDALLLQADGTTAALPLPSVRRVMRLLATDLTAAPTGESVVHDGQTVPLVPLAVPLRRPRATPRAARTAVVVAAAGGLAAFEVDRVLGVATVVVRPLPPAAPVDPVIAGVALDADGTPQLVLDPGALVAAAAHPRPVAPAAARRHRVLVIDDSLTTRTLEQSILESAGYEVDLAVSAEEGLARARQRRYGLFLVDVEMPGMDGFGFVATVRADPGLRGTPAILVTSRDAEQDRRRGAEVGANGYMVKGEFDQVRLLAMIQELLR